MITVELIVPFSGLKEVITGACGIKMLRNTENEASFTVAISGLPSKSKSLITMENGCLSVS